MLHGEAGYIVAAYAVAGFVICAVVVSVLVDYRAQRQALARLERLTGANADKDAA